MHKPSRSLTRRRLDLFEKIQELNAALHPAPGPKRAGEPLPPSVPPLGPTPPIMPLSGRRGAYAARDEDASWKGGGV
jgi:hypothetical protein